MPRKLLLIHGYSDSGVSFHAWAAKLNQRGFDANSLSICSYITLNNEVTISDIAEGLDAAIRGLGWDPGQDFDVIVHSTGMLVVRAWLASHRERVKHLKHLVGLAPATWGSPLAHLGRSFLSAILRGNRQLGPDFLAAGDEVLDELELGSRFTWALAHQDLLGPDPVFTRDSDTPYAAIFIGNTGYGGIKELANRPGTDGTVRWSGCALNSRKLAVNLYRPDMSAGRARWQQSAANCLPIPMFAVNGKDHGTLLTAPEDDLADRIAAFFSTVDSSASFDQWVDEARQWSAPAFARMNDGCDGWQQFVVHVQDEYGQSVPDFVLDLYTSDPTDLEGEALAQADIQEFDADVHCYAADQSYRCFHVQLPPGIVRRGLSSLWMRLSASSGSDIVRYCGFRDTGSSVAIDFDSPIILNLSEFALGSGSIFHPFTTTLVEITVSRLPLPKVLTIACFAPA